MGKLQTDYNYYESISLLNKGGAVIAASDEALVGAQSLYGDTDFQKTLGGELVISTVFISKKSGKAVFNLIYPILENGTQNAKGAILCVTSLNTVMVKAPLLSTPNDGG